MLIILDRDGVINEDSEEYVKSPEEWHPIPGSLAAVAQLKKAGFQVVIATNQAGVGRGLYTEETLARIHDKMLGKLQELGVGLDGIFYCPHKPADKCQCRKPQPGLLLSASKHLKVDLAGAIMVRDSLVDIQAARQVGVKPMLVLTGYGKTTLTKLAPNEVEVYPDLAGAVAAILAIT